MRCNHTDDPEPDRSLANLTQQMGFLWHARLRPVVAGSGPPNRAVARAALQESTSCFSHARLRPVVEGSGPPNRAVARAALQESMGFCS
jgi:hypothetical protein